MNRRSKILVFALLAFAAIAPQARGAPQFTGFAEEPTTPSHLEAALTGEQTTTIAYSPQAGGPSIECTELELAGRAKTGTDQSIAIRPEPKGCYSEFAPKTDVRMNGCEYLYTVTTKVGSDKYQGTMAIVCPEGKAIELTDTKSAGTWCRQTIPPQEGLGPVYFEDKTAATPDHLVTELNISEIDSTTTGGKERCGVLDGEHTNGTLTGVFTLKGFSTVAQVDFAVTGEAEPQFTAFGVASEEGGHVPTTLNAEQAGFVEFKPSSSLPSIYCPKASASGELASGTGAQVTLPFEYSNCESEVAAPLNLIVTVKPNECDQRYRVEEAIGEDEYIGKMDIICPPGKQMELTRTACIITIPPQEELGPVFYRVRKDVAPHDILIEPRVTLKSKVNGFIAGCTPSGEYTNGSYSGALTLRGFKNGIEPINLSLGGEEPSLEFTGAAASLPSVNRMATTVKGAQATTHQFVPEKGFSAISCGTTSLEGFLKTGTSSSLVAQPTYSGCSTASSLATNVRLNGCDQRLRPTKLVSADKYQGVTDVICPGSEEIEYEVTSGGVFKCLVTVPSQEGAGPVYFEDQTAATPDDVVLNFQVTNLQNATAGGLSNCGVANGKHTAGSYTGTSTARGYDAEEEQIEFQVSGE